MYCCNLFHLKYSLQSVFTFAEACNSLKTHLAADHQHLNVSAVLSRIPAVWLDTKTSSAAVAAVYHLLFAADR